MPETFSTMALLRQIRDALTGGSGGLTDTQLRASPVPVSVSGGATSAKQDTGNTSLASIDAKLTTQAGYLDGLEALVTSTNSYVDGMEGLVTTTNATLTTLSGYVDGLETLITATNGYVDDLETKLAGGLPAALAANGGLKIEGVAGGVAVPVSGTFYQATQPVSGTFWQATQPVSGTFWQATQPVSGTVTANLGTIAGVATETTLAAASAKLPATLGIKTAANSLSVAPASDASFAVTGTFWQATQPVSGTVAATQSGTWNVTNISGTVSLPTGAATAANQSSELTLIGAVTETAPATDTASSGLNGRLQRIAQRLTSLLPVGSNAAASSLGVTASTEDIARQGIVTETAPATDTASSGQNGRLQRIAQRITSLIALLPASLGAGGGLKVDGSGTALPVSGPQTNTEFLAALRSTATHSSVNSGASSVTILASNAARKGAIIMNTDANALYLDLSGGTAVAASRAQKKLATDESYEVPFGLTGAITGIWAADGSGVASVVEFA